LTFDEKVIHLGKSSVGDAALHIRIGIRLAAALCHESLALADSDIELQIPALGYQRVAES
jgi:hypothetical protein